MEIQNRTDSPFEARYHHPVTFALEAWSGSKRLEVEVPPFDGPVEPRSITVPPGERRRIPTPVTLRFVAEGGRTSESPFEWLVKGQPKKLRLRATKVFSDEKDLPCEVRLHVQ